MRFALFLMALPAFAQLAYFTLPPQSTECCSATDHNGNVFIVSWTYDAATVGTYDLSVMKFDASFNSSSIFVQPLPGFIPTAAATDPEGDIWIAGAGELLEISSGKIARTIPLGMSGSNGSLKTTALAIDTAGNLYAAGFTSQSDFPVTTGAFEKFPSITIPPALQSSYGFGFVAKYSNTGQRLASTFLTGSASDDVPMTAPAAIAIDANGVVTVAGTTNTTDYPVSSGAAQPACNDCHNGEGNFFISRLSADFNTLVWSTYLGGAATPFWTVQTEVLAGLALEPDGGAVIAGTTIDVNFPTTTGALESSLPAQVLTEYPGHGFVTRVNASGSAWIFSTYLAGSVSDTLYGIAADAQGDVWISGNTASPDFPSPPGTLALGNDLMLELAPDGSRLVVSEHLPAGGAGPILSNADGSFTMIGGANSLLRLPSSQVTGISILGVADSAASIAAATVAPGEFLSLYGTGLAASAGNTQVFFDGVAMPVLFASANQINVLAPYEIANRASTTLQVQTPAGASQSLTLSTIATQPNIFAIVNLDGTINSPAHPASISSYLSIYASGAGVLNPSMPDGSIAANPTPAPLANVQVLLQRYGNCQDEVLPVTYTGGSPGSVVNLLQVNFQFERQVEALSCIAYDSIQLVIAGRPSNSYPIYWSQ